MKGMRYLREDGDYCRIFLKFLHVNQVEMTDSGPGNKI